MRVFDQGGHAGELWADAAHDFVGRSAGTPPGPGTAASVREGVSLLGGAARKEERLETARLIFRSEA